MTICHVGIFGNLITCTCRYVYGLFYLFASQNGREVGQAETQAGKKSSVCRFTPQTAAVAGGGRRQEPET